MWIFACVESIKIRFSLNNFAAEMIPYEESYISVEESKDKVGFTMKRLSITTNSFMIQDLSMRTHLLLCCFMKHLDPARRETNG